MEILTKFVYDYLSSLSKSNQFENYKLDRYLLNDRVTYCMFQFKSCTGNAETLRFFRMCVNQII